MAFTNQEQIAMRRIFQPLINRRLSESTQADTDAFLSLLDPAIGTNTYVKARITEAKNALLAEQVALTANANARSVVINTEVGVLNALLTKFP